MIDITRYPVCEACDDPTKRVSGRLIDADGPGVITTLYTCDKRLKCDAIRLIVARREGIF